MRADHPGAGIFDPHPVGDQRLDLAAKLGATHKINAAKADAWKQIAEIFGAKGPDVFIDKLPAARCGDKICV